MHDSTFVDKFSNIKNGTNMNADIRKSFFLTVPKTFLFELSSG